LGEVLHLEGWDGVLEGDEGEYEIKGFFAQVKEICT
jgi:hypothetical protein